MVGVPSALHLSAGLLAVAAAAGLAFAILDGRLATPAGRTPTPGSPRDPFRLIGAAGGLVYAVSFALSSLLLGGPELWTWLHVVGLAGLAVGAGPRPSGRGVGLLVPFAPTVPAYLAAAAGVAAASRVMGAGRSALPAALGLGLMALGHGVSPDQAVAAAWLTAAGALFIGAWLWGTSTQRILSRLLAAFVTALLALSILLSVVLSTVGSAQLTLDELGRLNRLARGTVAEIGDWPAQAISSASAIAIAPNALLSPRTPEQAAELYRVGFADQDFFLVLDPAGNRITAHPPELSGSLELSLAGDPLIVGLRSGSSDGPEVGGLLASSGRIVAYGAVGLRPAELLPEDPPAGVLITGRLVDAVYAEQQSVSLDLGIVVVVGGSPTITSATVGADGAAVVAALDGRDAADLGGAGLGIFAASGVIQDVASGTPIGRVITTSTTDVIANLEQEQTRRLFVASLLGGILAVAVAAVVINRSVRPIGALTAAASRIGAGDLSSRADIDSPDEIGVLGQTFDNMVASLETQQAELSEAARIEARLRGRMESLTTSMGDGLIAVETDGSVIQFNPAAEALTGLTGRQVLGLSLMAALDGLLEDERTGEPPGDSSGQDPLALDDPISPASTAARLLLRRPDGTRSPVAVTASPVRSPDGEVLGRVFVLRDISREIEVERMKTEFLANVSHELRTPITPIKGYANVLARRDVGPEATQRFASEILSSTARLERIVGMIVDFAGLDSGRVVLQPEPVDLTVLVAEAIDKWRADHEGREFGNFLNGGLPPVLADPAYLRRVLDELLDNAVKFSPDGDPVDVTALIEGDRVRLSVIDRGIGIAPRAAAQLFTEFRQVDGTETRHYGGLGLGLGLVKRILDGTGATAEVESDPGVGATISVLLPVGGPIPPPILPSPPLIVGRVPPPP